ncbi:glycoside hydrolase family 5 protein [Pholiota conissans]|uniref:glucan 1,3-beta-glucosidase n=1 Tax=Pholiota conissans TaxID=109636 RepID=A0A9P5YMQ0_9AGAR|nr:glycoside hydrolase family 5 protein [Pholiota conissans]
MVEEEAGGKKPQAKRRRPLLIVLLVCLALVAIILAVILPVYFTVIKPRSNKTLSSAGGGASSGSPSGTGSAGPQTTSPPVAKDPVTGGDGSTIRLANGSTFTYNNKLGGIWYSDPDDPYNNKAYPNSWTPPLSQKWDYGKDRINGVNLGGWFVLEPFITPALFQKYPGAIDEWSLSVLMAADTASGGLNQLEDHYKTFITEQDIAEIAAAGLNWVRLPIPFWAIDKWNDEPFLEGVSWKYIVQAFQWCRKYGLRVKLDLHTIPGSQNGYNHSGKTGTINFLMGTMGMANAQRALNYIRIITEFISQPEWRDVVVMFGIMNEARISDIGTPELRGFYVEAYKMIRGITGIGEGAFISIHEGFLNLAPWAGFMSGSDRIALDMHPYFAFSGDASTDPINTGTGANAGGSWPGAACDRWTQSMNTSRTAFGVTLAGEWSNSWMDCGLFLTGVNAKGHSYGGDCADWEDSTNWNAGTKAGIQAFAEASMDALRDWFFWTWKIAPAQNGIVSSPLWSYSLGLANGWMPLDPRSAIGKCGASTGPVFDGTFESWMTGGAGAGDIGAAQTAQYPYPPSDLQGTPVDNLPLYTSTGAISTLPAPTYTDAAGKTVGVNVGNGWFNTNDNALAPTPIPGCKYPDTWDAQGAPIPTGCSGGANAAVPAAITPPPTRR